MKVSRPTQEEVQQWVIMLESWGRGAVYRLPYRIGKAYLELLDENEELKEKVRFWQQERDVLARKKKKK